MRFIRDHKKRKRLERQITINVVGILNGTLLDDQSYITLTGSPEELVEFERLLNLSDITDVKFYASRYVYESKLHKARKEFEI